MAVTPAVTPVHAWNDVNNDGLECVDCPEDSEWRFVRHAHGPTLLEALNEAVQAWKARSGLGEEIPMSEVQVTGESR